MYNVKISDFGLWGTHGISAILTGGEAVKVSSYHCHKTWPQDMAMDGDMDGDMDG